MARPRVDMEAATIAVLASFGRDADTLAGLIARAGARPHVCASGADLCAAFGEDTAALVITEESLPGAAAALRSCLDAQPSWSDVPVLILSGRHGSAGKPERWAYFRQFGNVTVLDRPMSGEAMMIALEAACRARAWQIIVREQMRRAESQNLELERQVRQRTAALQAEIEERKRYEQALDEARRLEAVGRLAGGVAHDFNNLLQIITGACNLLPHVRQNPERSDKLIDAILRAAERGSSLTHQMLAFGRRQALASTTVDVARQIAGMEELLRQSLRERIALDLRLAADLWPARADAAQLEVALINLMLNARYAMQGGGTVTLRADNVRLPTPRLPQAADMQGDFIRLCIADNGPGMPPEVAAQAFEPFFTTKPAGEGSGLGLSQVYGFARQSGGSAWIESDATGTRVSLLLPRSDGTEPQDADAPAAPRKPGSELAGIRVLLVEDDPQVGELTLSLLESFGCVARWARNADEALQKDLQDFDLVLSDVRMPGSMDGIALAREIARRRSAMPVLLVSGYMLAPERLRGAASKVLEKPFTAQALRDALLKSLSGKRAPRD